MDPLFDLDVVGDNNDGIFTVGSQRFRLEFARSYIGLKKENKNKKKTFFFAHQIEKSDILPCVRNVLSYTSYLTQGPRLVT